MKKLIIIMTLAILSIVCSSVFAGQTLVARKAGKAPVVDGMENDIVWAEAKGIITHDETADIDITLKAVYTDKEIFFLVVFPDADESRTHKSWVWDNTRDMYIMGRDREDVFVFKWNISAKPVDLSIYADEPYKADIWFWKARRTDPVGHADDKWQILDLSGSNNHIELSSRTGKKVYLLRLADSGASAYKTELQVEYKGETIPRFINQEPSGSRADIRAKGHWMGGKWTIEFSRKLTTGNNDDVQFDEQKSYQFGISRYEIGGIIPDASLSQPLYGSGDVSEELILKFE